MNGIKNEYNNINQLIYSGDYLNGKRHGKGIEYEYNNKNENIRTFKGEYLNGKRHGKGQEYEKGRVIFKGEYLNGERWNGEEKKDNAIYKYVNGEKIFKRYYKEDEISCCIIL